MAAIKPKGEKIRQAVKWVSDKLKSGQNDTVLTLVTEASLKYNLSPREEDYLLSFYKKNTNDEK